MTHAFRIAAVVVCVVSGGGMKGAVFASSQMQTYELHMEVPQMSQAANGDMVSITGDGLFSIHPKTVSANGAFTRSDSQGNVLASGTWVATQLLSFQPYGCGVIFGTPIPPNLCGGKLMLQIVLTDSNSGEQFAGVLWVLCLIGNPPPSAEEGARLDIVGIDNFNRIMSGGNVYIKTN
jgi:hypothetical protein